MHELGAESVPVVSIAKEREEIFVPQKARPIMLPRNSSALFLVQRIRDEAHRFALGYYQRVHRQKSMASILDEIPGIGSKRKAALLRRFGSVRAMRGATSEDMATVKGLTPALSKRVKQYLEEYS
jgi:excinuclease ABC subunit C